MTMFREVENKNLPCHLFGYILDAEENNAFFDTMDIYFAALGDGTAELEVPVSKMHYNTAGVVHGGVFAGLMDAAMDMAVLTKNKVGMIASMSTSYLKPAGKGDVLKAEAAVSLDGDIVCHCTCQIKNQRDELLAAGQGTFQIQIADFVQYYAAKLRENGYQ
ncbi:MAG: PaaI family thioesterase [Peptococcaceae bacterium]|nr:PaaI family thioesterase [Peptococcaceae bacterium]